MITSASQPIPDRASNRSLEVITRSSELAIATVSYAVSAQLVSRRKAVLIQADQPRTAFTNLTVSATHAAWPR